MPFIRQFFYLFITMVMINTGALAEDPLLKESLDELVCGNKRQSPRLESNCYETPYINQGDFPWCSVTSAYGLIGHMDYSLSGQESASDFYSDPSNTMSLFHLVANINKGNPEVDIDLNQSFSPLQVLLSLQHKDRSFLSDEALPFDHVCQLNSDTAKRLKDEINNFDKKLEPPYARYELSIGDNKITCSKDFLDKEKPREKANKIDFIFADLLDDTAKQMCKVNDQKLKNFGYMTRKLKKDYKVNPFRIHRYQSVNPNSVIQKW